ncbi:MAG: 7,8-didemethyl-8-hydroxy-5-deazariboflavin synthase subunit CofG [Anaerolineae bacterium]|nr:7,8-didemethyl-8-hydroxy-5-deazariboflavin synthase CofG [Anaerolineales bacterium]MCQ3972325.1 7,8-didemethyl-8-hydroxy-5-deazariboflavin synthase subunit CofG [Anaerolineae bacterium]
MQQASALRDAYHGRTVTYSRKVFIPLTNLCRDKCAYCTFAQAPNSPRAKTLTPEEVLQIARQGAAAGCKEALFSLGEKPEDLHPLARRHLAALGYSSTHEYLQAMCRLVFTETGLIPHANPGVMSRAEMAALRPWNGSMGMMLENVSPRLMEPSQAHFGCVGKAPRARLETLAHAGELKVPFTTGILIGIGETPEERVDSLFAIADMRTRYGQIQEVIIQNFRRKSDIRFRDKDEPSVLDMLRTIAVARLILGGAMNLQAPPNLTPDAYGLYLLAGINDWGGVSPVTADHINPEAAWPKIAELRAVTAEAGFELRERLTIYPEYLTQRPDFVEPHLYAHARQWVDEQGLVKREWTFQN